MLSYNPNKAHRMTSHVRKIFLTEANLKFMVKTK